MFVHFDRPVPGWEPADGIRTLVFLANLAAQETTGDTASSTSTERLVHRLVGSTVHDVLALALIDDLPVPPGSKLSDLGYPLVPATGDDDTELVDDAEGFLLLGLPLQEDTGVVEVEFILDAGYLPIPGEVLEAEGKHVIHRLLAEAERVARVIGRNTLQTWLLHSPDEPAGTGEFADLLREYGYLPGLTEIQGFVDIQSNIATTAIGESLPQDASLRAEIIRDLCVPEALIPGLIELYRLASVEVPHGSLDAEPVEWTPRRLHQAAKRVVTTERSMLSVLLIDDSGVIGLSEVTCHPGSDPDVLEQGITIIHPRARGRGLGLLLKRELLHAVATELPAARRIYTSCASVNSAMIAVNEALGWRVLSGGSGWQKHLPTV
ncbi:GNAT family N-acetyltransferase [Corynebacterium alimapuense]|uniref:N-acetyltransferase domain-containing protein n=1 Tax=Corynebacterium alimapuense TaxID=1576874 RepID=A0A3M8KA55_9CORY|nr:GNAT family N-acetyltransferase [Corynebacterium alimapuense]RNE49338.1 hypothetical protein C5L39_02940 [Corynebacterium alimapuense]